MRQCVEPIRQTKSPRRVNEVRMLFCEILTGAFDRHIQLSENGQNIPPPRMYLFVLVCNNADNKETVKSDTSRSSERILHNTFSIAFRVNYIADLCDE